MLLENVYHAKSMVYDLHVCLIMHVNLPFAPDNPASDIRHCRLVVLLYTSGLVHLIHILS